VTPARMTYADVCAGISAATVAWKPLGWRTAFYSEIDKFPCAVLRHHYPDTPNHGDMTKYDQWPDAALDVLIGGTPCQGFSVAGLRKGLDDPRSNLALCFGLVAQRYRPRWLVWENVPGVRSANGGRDLGAFLRGLAELGYGLAWRSFDAQYAGLAQRRERVFVVGHLGDWRRAAAVLSFAEGLRWDSAPRREKRQRVAGTIAPGTGGGSGHSYRQGDPSGLIASTGERAHCLNAGGMGRIDYESETLIAHSLRADGFDASEDGTGRGTPLVPIQAFYSTESRCDNIPPPDISPPLKIGSGGSSGNPPAIAFAQNQLGEVRTSDLIGTLNTNSNASGRATPMVATNWAVRRLTPRECERLQGFPDDYTAIPWRGKPAEQCPDGPRYKALGNSIAVPELAWIGKRIMLCESVAVDLAEAA
jgi:DNA (cytosine-5)-methyltransferase 1